MNPYNDPVALSALNLNQLVALQRLLHECSVGRAARSMGVTQSAMSHTLRQLRELLDDPLLVRVGNDMVATPYALEILPRLQGALGELEAIVSGRAAFDPATITDTFTLGTSDGPAGIMAGRLYADLAARAPNARLRIAPMVIDTLVQELVDGTLDAAFMPSVVPIDGLSSVPLGKATFSVVCRADHPRVKKRLTLAAYCDLPHVMVSITGEGPSFTDDLLAREGRERRIAVRVAHLIAVPGLLLESDMLHTNADPANRFLCQHWNLKSFPVPFEFPSPGDLLLVWHPRYDNEPASRFFREVVFQAAHTSAADQQIKG